MRILIKSIGDPTIVAQKNDLKMTRFQVDFETPNLSGEAHLFVMHSSPNTDMKTAGRRMLNHIIDVDVSCEAIYEFTEITGEGHDHIDSLGESGGFLLEGRITEHLFTGEGSIFQSGDICMVIGIDKLPSFSLEVEPGTWVSFKTNRLNFWLPTG